jgi:quercetin dioxygenase-like cupin family protein
MSDTTVKKIDAAHSPSGEMGQRYLATGRRVGMRLWSEEPGEAREPARSRDYEVVGYVIAGRAELHSEGQTVRLEPGDSWLVPAGAEHHYEVQETFTAVEATSPPAHVHDRDAPVAD